MVIHNSIGDSALVNAPVNEVVAINFEKLSRKERRDLNRRLLYQVREERNADRERRAAPIRQAEIDPRVKQLGDFAKSVGVNMSDSQLRLILGGAEMRIDGYIVSATSYGELRRRKDDTAGIKVAGIWMHMKSHHGIDCDSIRNDPVGSYAQMLKRVDPCAWDRLFGNVAKNKSQ